LSRPSFHRDLRRWANAQACEPQPEAFQAVDDRGYGALHAIAEEEEAGTLGASHYASRAKAALDQGASPSSGEFFLSNAPLHWCAWHAAPGTARALLAYGANPRTRNRNSETPADICRNLMRQRIGDPNRQSKMEELLALLCSESERGELCSHIPERSVESLEGKASRL
jgi:hypothetical protein